MRLWVSCVDKELEDELDTDSVLLPYHCSSRLVAAALEGIGIYAPRGADSVMWDVHPGAVATIFDGNGDPTIYLREIPNQRGER
ncbi:MAG: hypothetical protein ACHREM_01000 [Polyangiales bacterium]